MGVTINKKCLCITITENIDWGQHISEICTEATKALGVLRRNLAFAPKEVAHKNFGFGLN